MTNLNSDKESAKRCEWSSIAPEFILYHDEEWGFPVNDDFKLFEKLCLEGFQSGLSWRTIYNKRDNFRRAFHDFDFHKIALFDDADRQRLINDAGIIRHKGKIEAVINNAKRALEMVAQEGSLAAFFWRYEPVNTTTTDIPSTSKESIALSKELKKRGWKFVGPTTAYAFMQAMGIVNDHAQDCCIYAKVEQARNTFKRPNQ